MSFLRAFGGWLQEQEMAGRPDGGRVAEELTRVAVRITDDAGVEQGERVLDIGAGTGAVGLAAADLGGDVVAVDIDGAALGRGRELAQHVGAPVRHAAADARALPFGDHSFAVSVHRSVFVYMEDRERAVAEERRVLRPGGRVSCSESVGAEIDLETADSGVDRVWRGGLRDILIDSPDLLTLAGLERLYRDQGFAHVGASAHRHAVLLDSSEAVARAFATSPPAGLSARDRWAGSGIPGPLVDEFLARLAAEAEGGRPAQILASEAFLTARIPA